MCLSVVKLLAAPTVLYAPHVLPILTGWYLTCLVLSPLLVLGPCLEIIFKLLSDLEIAPANPPTGSSLNQMKIVLP